MWQDTSAWDIDEVCLDNWVAEAAAGLAQAVAAACSVIDFECVLIDGWCPPNVRAQVVSAVTEALAQLNLAGLHAPVIREGTIGPDARALGAASLPLSERFLVEPNT
jgi:predicted NBD/HSP70 family sugar kinase